MFRKLGKWLFWAFLLIAAGSIALNFGKKAAGWVEKENDLLSAAGEEASAAIRSVGEAGQAFLSRAGEEQLTILFTGLNEAWSEPDAIMLIAIDLSQDSVRAIRIDRDIFVSREERGIDCIGDIYASAYAQARKRSDSETEAVRKGNIALKGFLKENMGLTIDHYLSLNREGLSALVDAIGGVTVKLTQPVDYDNDSLDLHVHLKAGDQPLDGEQAVRWIRLGNEYDEADTQKLFLSAFFRKIKQESSLTKAFALLKESLGRTVSSLTLPDLFPLVRSVLSISPSQVKSVVLQGTPASDGREVLSRSKTIGLLSACLPESGIDEDHFDRHRVFTSEGEPDKLYYRE